MRADTLAQASPQWLSSFLFALRDAVAVFDGGGTLLLANRSFRQLFGTRGGAGWWPDPAVWGRLVEAVTDGDGDGDGDGDATTIPIPACQGEADFRVTVVRLAATGEAAPVFVALFRREVPVAAASAFDDFVTQLTARIRAMKLALERLEGAAARPVPNHVYDRVGADREGFADLVLSRLRLLSQREQQIVAELVNGKRIPSIAGALYLSENTVRNYLKRVYRKVGVHSAAELREILTPPGAFAGGHPRPVRPEVATGTGRAFASPELHPTILLG